MSENALAILELVSDQDLLERTRQLARGEARVTALLVAHLAELDARRLYVPEGCASLFAYCTDVLQLSEGAAYKRIRAARAVRRFPLVLDYLMRGTLHLGAIAALAPALTGSNHRAALARAAGMARIEVERLAAELHASENASHVVPTPAPPPEIDLFPTAAPPTTVETLASVEPQLSGESPSTVETPGSTEPRAAVGPPVAEPSSDPECHHVEIRPMRPPPGIPSGRVRLVFHATEQTHDQLFEARDLLRHVNPTGDMDTVLARAVDLLVRTLRSRKLGGRRRGSVLANESPDRTRGGLSPPATPPTSPPPAGSVTDAPSPGPAARTRYIPASVRRQVWQRDSGRCRFVSKSGRRCRETGRLEFHHRVPFARGGESVVENLELRCRTHNQFEELPEEARRHRGSK